MRWRFVDPEDPRETAELVQRLRSIDGLWAGFAAQASQAALACCVPGGREGVEAGLGVALHTVHPELGVEVAPGGRGLRLTVWPRRPSLRPMVATLVERAPELPGWEVSGHRPARAPLDVAHRMGLTLPERVRARLVADEHRRVGVVVSGLSLPPSATCALVTGLLGDDLAEAWLGQVAVEAAPGFGWELDALLGAFSGRVHALWDELPDRPLWELGDDGRTCSCARLAARAARSTVPFHSDRFSRHGEVFCTLRVEEVDSALLVALATSLDRVLRRRGLGCLVGLPGESSHLDLALQSVEASLPALQRVVHRYNQRGRLHFHDQALAEEWVALHPGARSSVG